MAVWNDWVLGILDGSHSVQLFAEDFMLKKST